MTMTERCKHISKASSILRLDDGAQCHLESGHSGVHHYKCEGDYCPGLSYSASFVPHPPSCQGGAINLEQDHVKEKLGE